MGKPACGVRMRFASSHRFLVGAAALVLIPSNGCRRPPATISVIPRTCGTRLWEPFHAGAAAMAHQDAFHIYWNAPTDESDSQKQIGFLDAALKRRSRGIVLAPDATAVFRTPVQKALARHIPVVIVDDDLGLPHNSNLSYVSNDEVAGGRIAARRVASVLKGTGSVALLGINPRMHSMQVRQRSFEETLANQFPGIRIAVREYGDLSVPHEQQIAEQVLHANSRVDAIVALSASTTRGAYYAKVESGQVSPIVLIGFDQDLLPPIRAKEIDSVVIQNSPEIGSLAVQNVVSLLAGKDVPEKVLVEPVLLTRENLDSPVVHGFWHYARFPWSEQ